MQRIQVIDSHTGGEPTRVVISGFPDLGQGTLVEKRDRFRAQFDEYRSAIVNEPRGSDVLIGALLCPPSDPTCAAGVIFFNNVGYLHMCGHGTIGLAVTLHHMGKITTGFHRLETTVGIVGFELREDNKVTVQNVPSYRYREQVAVTVQGHGVVHGDIAWGGNWFFLVSDHGQVLDLKNVETLTHFCKRIKESLVREGITGENGQEIDHIELFGPPVDPRHNSRNFVLCPGNAYDRSPCGTGTSAKIACLAASGKLKPGEVWMQESIVGSLFVGAYTQEAGKLIPHIQGHAYVTAESTLLLDSEDPYRMGIRA